MPTRARSPKTKLSAFAERDRKMIDDRKSRRPCSHKQLAFVRYIDGMTFRFGAPVKIRKAEWKCQKCGVPVYKGTLFDFKEIEI